MRSLITGGAGFIGSHLAEHLLGLGHQVVILDDLSTGSERNLDGFRDDPGLELVHGTVLDRDTVNDCVAGVDAVFHLAAAVGVFTILDKPLHSLRTNLHGTENVLDAAVLHDVPVLVASSSEVYGKSSDPSFSEDGDRVLGSPLTSRWSYAQAKAMDESLAAFYAAELGLRTVIVRLFNTVGPRQSGRYGMVIPRFVQQALDGEPITVFGDGEQIRCFCHVLDVVPALAALLADGTAHAEVYNLGNPEQTNILDLARRVIAVTGSGSPIRTVPYHEAYGPGFEDMRRRVPDIRKVQKQIDFAPSRTLADIIDAVVADVRRRPQPVSG